MKSWNGRFSGLVICALMVLTGCEASEAPDPATQAPPIEVTALELAQAFDDNEAAAQQKYGSNPLLVSGTVSAITLDFADDPVVEMKGVNDFSDVQLSLADEAHSRAAEVKKGQKLTLRCGSKLTLRCGSIGEVVGSPMLSDCTFPAEEAAGAPSEAAENKAE